MTAPEHFVQALRAYDPRLRVRWAPRMEAWIIERKMAERSPTLLGEKPSPYKSKRGLDLWDGWKDGYVHILTVHPTLLQWGIVHEELANADIHVQGSWEAIARRFDQQAEAEEAASDKETRTWAAQSASETFDRLQWLLGNRVATPFGEPALPLVKEEVREGYIVRDRRVSA